jgi:hypothetical protein
MSQIPTSNLVLQEIIEKTKSNTSMFSQKLFKDTLRFLISTFSKIHYIDRNNNAIPVKCFHANQERAIAKTSVGDNITLPVITISEQNTEQAKDRSRYGSLLVHQNYWHNVQQRAVRTLSLVPTPIDINYSINIWTKYKEDMDQIREYIISIFNPDIEIQTKHNGKIKSFILNESDVEQAEASDKDDRILKKTFSIVVQTYIPNPKFLYTSTGKIEKFIYNFDLDGLSDKAEGTVKSSSKVCHDKTCTCEDCLLPLILITGDEVGIPVDCEAISVIVDGTLGA